MADPTYQPKVYLKQGGDERVVASGGKQTVESGGELEMQSGGFFDAQSGSGFYFNETSVTSLQMMSRLSIPLTTALRITAGSATASKLSVLNLPRGYRYVFLSMQANLLAGSFWVTSCLVGDEVYLAMKAGGVAVGNITVSTSGCTIIGTLGIGVSTLILYNSAASVGWAHLVCMEDTVWSVAATSSATSCLEQASS